MAIINIVQMCESVIITRTHLGVNKGMLIDHLVWTSHNILGSFGIKYLQPNRPNKPNPNPNICHWYLVLITNAEYF